MKLEPIIVALRARCPSFGKRVAGAAQFRQLQETAALIMPCAYVVPIDDEPQESMSQNANRQELKDSFAVIVALSNQPDEKGQGSASGLHALRAELWGALLGWEPDPRYDPISYEGGQILSLDRARMFYQFEFGSVMEITPADGWQGNLDALPHFDGVAVRVDCLDPADPNRPGPPDGRFESVFTIPKEGSFP